MQIVNSILISTMHSVLLCILFVLICDIFLSHGKLLFFPSNKKHICHNNFMPFIHIKVSRKVVLAGVETVSLTVSFVEHIWSYSDCCFIYVYKCYLYQVFIICCMNECKSIKLYQYR